MKLKKLIPLLVCVGPVMPVQAFFDNLGQGLSDMASGLVAPQQQNQQAAVTPSQPRMITVEVARASKTINMRSGPGTDFGKVGSFSAGSQANVVSRNGDWVKLENGQLSGWVYAPLVSITQQQVPASANASAMRENIYYAGYSKAFKPLKDSYSTGELDNIENFFTSRENQALDGKSIWDEPEKVGLLRWMERGTLYLDQGNRENAIRALDNAEFVIQQRSEKSKLQDLLTWGAGTILETATGMEEFVDYPGEGFEKVLMLNYKSIAYLLDGDRRAYNVTRRAIDWQDLEKRQFEEELRSAQSKLSDEKKTAGSSAAGDDWSASYDQYDNIASRVASAYVNPFGYYVAGMVQDFESRKDRSLRENARISYEKALELNPDSDALKKTVSDMKNRKLDDSVRLLHVVVGDGFVPEKKVMEYNFQANGQVVPVKLPLYEPVPSRVARVEVQTVSGKKIATLSSIADIEAITMRHQKDTDAFRSLRVLLSIVRSVGVNNATRDIPIFGALLSKQVNDMSAPDTRSWMSLPADIKAARLVLKKSVSKIRLVSYDSHGGKLASKVVDLDKNSDNFVYARSIDNQLFTNSSQQLWTF